MEKRQIIATLFERTGIRLDEDDPALAIVELNKIILEDAAAETAQRIEDAAQKFSDAVAAQTGDIVVLVNDALSKLTSKMNEMKELFTPENAPQTTSRTQTFIDRRNPATGQQQGQSNRNSAHWMLATAFLGGAVIGLLVGVVFKLI